MPGKVWMNGVVVAPEDAKISIFDRGFLYGDSVFETLRVYEGVPFAFTEHLMRLRGSAERVGLVLPWTDAFITEATHHTLKEAELLQAYLRITVTRGVDVPQLIIMVRELPALPQTLYTQGRTAWCVRMTRGGDPAAKTGNYLGSIMATQKAALQGADEALLVDEAGCVTEAASANVFALIGGVWCTPPAQGILAGITRQTILNLCHDATERSLTVADIQAADEVFVCASVREIVPIVRVDDALVGTGRVGVATQRVHGLYREHVGRLHGCN